jgi:hypothetical protein
MKTQQAIVFSVLSLGFFTLFLPGAYGSLSNSLAVICRVLPTALIMGLAKRLKPNGFGQFLCGLCLVAVGLAFFAYSSYLQLGLDALFYALNTEAGTNYDKSDIGFGEVSLWVFLIPAVSVGVGVNLLSAHLSSENEA